jgi:hypothetical protein
VTFLVIDKAFRILLSVGPQKLQRNPVPGRSRVEFLDRTPTSSCGQPFCGARFARLADEASAAPQASES